MQVRHVVEVVMQVRQGVVHWRQIRVEFVVVDGTVIYGGQGW